ncbi:hypothetical protein GQ43DRAFT_474197 [Delitschia confertaspora ATCC 74209]|uniref:Uncharacterized protein n=1 Tax=Delitschia confertaspora ATCC 74209 TaxID=1513339 RepID=A0A9P4JG56_9PLEO|nr:hypothetical protein GQ43DRAFT_474197 [Delitschia confertaspora ATCC 74209]
MDKTIEKERGGWLYWYHPTQKAGDSAWRKLVPAAKAIGATGVNTLVVTFGSLDMILEVLEAYLGIRRQRVGFSEELMATLAAMIALRKEKGKYMHPFTQMKFTITKRNSAQAVPPPLMLKNQSSTENPKSTFKSTP